ncbi:MAG TPA: hypothetical protein VF950_10980 [Planctomycetota bacterium]
MRRALAVGLGVLLFLAGYAVGRRPERRNLPGTVLQAPAPAVHVPHPEPERAPAFDPRLTALPLPELLGERGRTGDENPGRAAALDAELRRRMSEDPEVLDALLVRFMAAPDRALAALLGSFRHPRIEAAALALTETGRAKASRLIAFEVLDRLDHLAPENHAALIERLRTENDPEVLAEGLYALPHGPSPPELRAASRALLRSSAEHVDAQVRVRAALALGQGPVEDADLPALLGRLADPVPEARATAAASLRNYRGGQGEPVRAALAARMADVAEAAAVRRQAWQTLAQLPMDPATWAAWDAYRRATQR